MKAAKCARSNPPRSLYRHPHYPIPRSTSSEWYRENSPSCHHTGLDLERKLDIHRDADLEECFRLGVLFQTKLCFYASTSPRGNRTLKLHLRLPL